MAHPQLRPLQVNAATGEPFLRLPDPLSSIIITPPRSSDAPYIVQHMNDPTIVKWVERPPYPYLPSHADEWLLEIKTQADAVLEELKAASQDNPSGPLKIVGECPVRVLREVHEDGSDTFLGDVGVQRCAFGGEEDPEVQRRLSEDNARREVGDPEIVWCVGDYLASSHHGRGIMSVAVRTLLTSWVIPRMGARRLRVEMDKANGASLRVFEKFGFKLQKTVDKVQTNNFGATKYGTHVLWWEQE